MRNDREIAAKAAPAVVVRHWCYPSTIVACGLDIDDLRAIELAWLRSEVTCEDCLARLRSDREICEACRDAQDHVSVRLARSHVCDPEIA